VTTLLPTATDKAFAPASSEVTEKTAALRIAFFSSGLAPTCSFY
jgi:hypothetical protein